MYAWLHHQKWNKHHWEYWVIPSHGPLNMPDKYVREMVADWFAAGRAFDGAWDAKNWYLRQDLLLHPLTRVKVEGLLEYGSIKLERR
jgi:hypothetical protein